MKINPIETAEITKSTEISTERNNTANTNNVADNVDTTPEIVVDSGDEDAVLCDNTIKADNAAGMEKAGSSKSKAEKKLSKLKSKLEKLETKYDNTESDKKADKLEKKIDKLEEKIEYYEGLVEVQTSDDNSLNKLYAKKYKAEYKADNTESEKKEARLEKTIEKLDAKIEEKEKTTNVNNNNNNNDDVDDVEDDDDIDDIDDIDDDDDDDDDDDTGLNKAGSSNTAVMTSSDSKLQKLYDQLSDKKKDYNNAKTEAEADAIEEEIDKLEEQIEEREEEIENTKAGAAQLHELNMFVDAQTDMLKDADNDAEKTEIKSNIFQAQDEIDDLKSYLNSIE
ncbi:MAG: hypothetical protein K6A44_03520 [bacterium]|nr:hypothetical protein [bacterium]